MKMVKSLLLGSAAGLVAVAGAQAADLPVKAKAVEYVKVCSLYGAGFYYIPGTDTCIKIGGYTRLEANYNAGAGLNANIAGAAGMNSSATNETTFRTRVALTTDTRTQTEYGTLRSYMRAGFNWVSDSSNAAAINNNSIYFDRGFIQFAGFTFGKTTSFFDFYDSGLYSYQTAAFNGDTGPTGQTVAAYTAQFGNGVSLSIAAEESRQAYLISSSFDGDIATTYAFNGLTRPAGQDMPDLVANLRVDQAWGSAQVMGALHKVANVGAPAATDDKYGWAAGAGLTLKMPWAATDTLSLQGVYAEGAARYAFNPAGAQVNLRRGGEIGVGVVADAAYNGDVLDLSQAWSVAAAFQHYWTPALRSSVYGQYGKWESNSDNFDAAGNRDWNGYQIGTRTAWNPVANLEIGLDVMYTKVDTAYFSGGTVTHPNVDGVTSTNVGDTDIWSAQFRVQRNFWP
jgi:hypothetical protein